MHSIHCWPSPTHPSHPIPPIIRPPLPIDEPEPNPPPDDDPDPNTQPFPPVRDPTRGLKQPPPVYA